MGGEELGGGGEPQTSSAVVVGGLSAATTEKSIHDLASRSGPVEVTTYDTIDRVK